MRFKRQADVENEIFDELDVKTVRILKKYKISVGLAYFFVGALILQNYRNLRLLISNTNQKKFSALIANH